jgi:uracil-DNA glycosylase family 4
MSVGAPIPPRDVSHYDPRKRGARCDICPLSGSAYVPPLPPESGDKPRFILVGEGPGHKEVLRREPFVGATGELLNDALTEVGLRRSDAFITNAALCKPETDKEAERSAECCAPRLLKELAQLDVDIPIVTLGKAATRSVLGVKSILLARGFVWTARDLAGPISGAEAALRKADRGKKPEKVVEARLRLDGLYQRHKLAGRTILPTLHPTFAFIHNEAWAPIFHVDLERAARWIRGELTHEKLADRIDLVKSVTELRKRKDTFIVTENVADIAKVSKLLGPEIACDIETERINPISPLIAQILCVQLSDGDRSLVIGPWKKEIHAPALTEFLAGRTVVFHNGYNFDHPALERDGVSLAKVKLEDTLVAHHSFASHYPQKLDHVVATFLDSSPWKIRFGVRGAEEKGLAPTHVEDNELYLYGASDAVLTIRAWRAMQSDLEPERQVYEHDKLLGVQGKMLQVVGFRVDRNRRRLLSKKLKLRAAYLKGRMRSIAHKPNFQPSRLGEVRRILFGTLKAPMLNPTATGLASTSNATLEVIRTGGAGTARRGPADTVETGGPINNETKQTRAGLFAEAILRWRVAEKIRSTYINAVSVHADGRAHYNWRPYGTVSGRYSCRLQSCPRWSTAVEDRAREMYLASVGCVLLYFDLSQAEARMAANLSGDENFIATCKGDVHTGNAKILFPQEDALEMLTRDPKGKHCPQHGEGAQAGAACNCGKPYRDIAKNAGFAVAYLAEAATVFAYLRAHGFPVELDDVETMLSALKASYRGYYEYVAENVAFCEREGFLRTAMSGRIRWFGFHPKPQEIANFPIQSGIADVMNSRLLRLQGQLAEVAPGVRLVAQVHDAAIFDAPLADVDTVKGLIVKTWDEPVRIERSVVCREAREFLLPAEIKVGKRWSDFG